MSEQMPKVAIQGFPGSFHDDVSRRYFGGQNIEIHCAESFRVQVHQYLTDPSIDFAMMAIENSIAGTILQNYKLIREHQLNIVGEAYLRIRLQLMALPGQRLSDIKEIHSHPMALYQCTKLLNTLPNVKLVESEDTALSAKMIADSKMHGIAAIASQRASELYKLSIVSDNIEDNKANYTRFFCLSKHINNDKLANKASIWCRISHKEGSLVNVLSIIANHGVNLSKLQSYPILGKLNEYSFHMDLEFDTIQQYSSLKEILHQQTLGFHELGVYKRADLTPEAGGNDVSVML